MSFIFYGEEIHFVEIHCIAFIQLHKICVLEDLEMLKKEKLKIIFFHMIKKIIKIKPFLLKNMFGCDI